MRMHCTRAGLISQELNASQHSVQGMPVEVRSMSHLSRRHPETESYDNLV